METENRQENIQYDMMFMLGGFREEAAHFYVSLTGFLHIIIHI